MARIPRLLPLIAIAIGGVVAVKAIGVGPGLFEGAKAWAEEATGAVTPAAGTAPGKPAPAVCALTEEQLAQQAGMSPAELRIIQSLMKRRTELDARDTDFATTLPLMAAAEQKLDAKIQALNALKGEIQGLLGQVDEKEKAETDRLVAVYTAMRPREAAAVFVSLDDGVRLPIAAAMRPRSLSAVMAQMPAAAARELTEKLARRYQAQQMAAKAAVANAAEAPVQSAASAPAPAAATAPAEIKPVAQAPRRPAARPAARPTTAAARPAANRPSPATPATSAPQPYQAPAPTTAAPPSARQSVQ